MKLDEAGWLELIENIVFPWSYSNEFPEEPPEEEQEFQESRRL